MILAKIRQQVEQAERRLDKLDATHVDGEDCECEAHRMQRHEVAALTDLLECAERAEYEATFKI